MVHTATSTTLVSGQKFMSTPAPAGVVRDSTTAAQRINNSVSGELLGGEVQRVPARLPARLARSMSRSARRSCVALAAPLPPPQLGSRAHAPTIRRRRRGLTRVVVGAFTAGRTRSLRPCPRRGQHQHRRSGYRARASPRARQKPSTPGSSIKLEAALGSKRKGGRAYGLRAPWAAWPFADGRAGRRALGLVRWFGAGVFWRCADAVQVSRH